MSSVQSEQDPSTPKKAHDLRVWFVTRKWPPAMGGMETYSVRLSEQLESRLNSELVTLAGHADGSVPTASELVRFGLNTAFRVTGVSFDADVIHLGDMAIWPIGWVARFRRTKLPVVISAHGTDLSYAARGGIKGRLYGTYLRLGAKLVKDARVIANSTATADAARSFGFKDVQVVSLATDMAPSAVEKRRNVILFSGRLVRRKGLKWFVENVLPELPQELTLEVAGTKWDAGEAEALNHPRVSFLGNLKVSDLQNAYASATCVVVPNIDVPNGEFEGFGLVAVEAAASGGLVVAAHHSGLKEAVLDGRTGFSLPPGDAAAWIAKIREIYGWSEDQRNTFTESASREAARYFNWSRVADETIGRYQR